MDLHSIVTLMLALLAPITTFSQVTFAQYNNGGPRNEKRPSNGINSKFSGLETMDIIQDRGFIGEMYPIKSNDGYPLTIYHIINPLANQRTLNKFPVIIAHGLLSNSAQMLSMSEKTHPRPPLVGDISAQADDDCLAFMLANNNFDVWMFDSRGTTLNDHDVNVDVNLVDSNKFWNYSLDEQALNDVPAIIDYVLEQTQSEKVIYIGYSESTFFMFALLSVKPEYADKLATFVALAPVAYVSHLRGIASTLLLPFHLLPSNFNANVLPQPIVDTVGYSLRQICSTTELGRKICGKLSQPLSGGGETNYSRDFMATMTKSTSIKAMKQFVQLYLSKRFAMYDYGYSGNVQRYGRPVSPSYDLAKIKLPTIITIRGGQDYLSTPEDQMTLINELGTKPLLDIWLPEYNHFDVISGRNVLRDVNIPILTNVYRITSRIDGRILRDTSKPYQLKFMPIDTVMPHTRSIKDATNQNHFFEHIGKSLKSNDKFGLLPRVFPRTEKKLTTFDSVLNTLATMPNILDGTRFKAFG